MADDGGKATEWWCGINDLRIGEWGLRSGMEKRGEERGVMGWDCMGCENIEMEGRSGVEDLFLIHFDQFLSMVVHSCSCSCSTREKSRETRRISGINLRVVPASHPTLSSQVLLRSGVYFIQLINAQFIILGLPTCTRWERGGTCGRPRSRFKVWCGVETDAT